MREKIGSHVDLSDPLWMSFTCCRPLGRAAADDAFVMPPLSLDTNVSARLAVLLVDAHFSLSITLGIVRTYASDFFELPCGAIFTGCSSKVNTYWSRARFWVSPSESACMNISHTIFKGTYII